jgi:hypothetical protein
LQEVLEVLEKDHEFLLKGGGLPNNWIITRLRNKLSMDKLENAIIYVLEHNPGLSDRELTDVLKGSEATTKHVNQYCKSLESQGILIRKKRLDRLIGSWLKDTKNLSNTNSSNVDQAIANELPDKKMKRILERFLLSQGWNPEINWRPNHGVDIEAKRDLRIWIIEVKGSRYPSLIPVNSFVSLLGEILQRMDNDTSKYSIAMPDTGPFDRLWKRLPSLAKSRTGISALFVNPSGFVRESFQN